MAARYLNKISKPVLVVVSSIIEAVATSPKMK
jgi:hypothetical protein